MGNQIWGPYAGMWEPFGKIFSSNSEAFASELLENLEDMLPQYCMHSDW